MSKIEFKVEGEKGAIFGPDRVHRYWLWRRWGQGSRYLVFVGLNPSTADESVNDPTVERMERRAREYGFDGLIVVNIFAYRTPYPEDLKDSAEAGINVIGRDNDRAIIEACRRSEMVVAGWGAHANYMNRADTVKSLLSDCRTAFGAVTHLGLTKHGHPRHPLYISYKVKPKPWVEAE